MKSIPLSVEILSTIEKIKRRLRTSLLVLTVLILRRYLQWTDCIEYFEQWNCKRETWRLQRCYCRFQQCDRD